MNRITAQRVLDNITAPGWRLWLEAAQDSHLVHVEQCVPNTEDQTTTWCHDELFWLHTVDTPAELRRRVAEAMLVRTVHEFLHHFEYRGRAIFDQHRKPDTVVCTRRFVKLCLP